MKESILAKSLKDFLSKKFLFMSLAPLIVPILVLGGIFIYGSGELVTLLHQGASTGDFSYLDESAYPTLTYLLGFSVVQWLIVTLFVVFGTLSTILVSLIIAVITVGLLTPTIVKTIRKKSYLHVEKGKEDNLFVSLLNVFKIFMKFILLFLCTLPFLLLPFVNVMIFQLPFFYLFYKLMMYDMISVGMSKNTLEVIEKHKFYLIFVLILFFLVSLVPLLGLLLQVFFVVYLSHFILSKSQLIVSTSNTDK